LDVLLFVLELHCHVLQLDLQVVYLTLVLKGEGLGFGYWFVFLEEHPLESTESLLFKVLVIMTMHR